MLEMAILETQCSNISGLACPQTPLGNLCLWHECCPPPTPPPPLPLKLLDVPLEQYYNYLCSNRSAVRDWSLYICLVKVPGLKHERGSYKIPHANLPYKGIKSIYKTMLQDNSRLFLKLFLQNFLFCQSLWWFSSDKLAVVVVLRIVYHWQNTSCWGFTNR